MNHSYKIISILLGISLSTAILAKPGDKAREMKERAQEAREKTRRDSFKREREIKIAEKERLEKQIAVNKYVGAVQANGGVAPKWAEKSEGAKAYKEINTQFQASIDRNKAAIMQANTLGVDTAVLQQQFQAGLAAGKLASGGFVVQGVETKNTTYQKAFIEAQKKFGPLPSSVADELAGKTAAEQKKFLQNACLIGNCNQPAGSPSTTKIDRLEAAEMAMLSKKYLPAGRTQPVIDGGGPVQSAPATTTNTSKDLIPTQALTNPWALSEMDRIQNWANSKFVNPLGVGKVDFKAQVDLVNGDGKSQDINMLQWAFLNQTNMISNVTYTNGIRNNKDDATKTATQIASATGGIITLVHNPTWTDKNNDNFRWEIPGAIQDMVDTRSCQLGACGESAKYKLTDMLRLSGGNLFMTGHSQGTTIMANAIKDYKKEGGDISKLTVVAAGAVDSMPSDVKTHYVYETNNAGSYDNVANSGKLMPVLANPFLTHGAFELAQTNFDINLARAGLSPNQDYTRINSGASCRDGLGCHSADVIAEYLKITGTVTPSWVASDGIRRYGDAVMTKKENSGGGLKNEIKNASYYCAGAGNCSDNRSALNMAAQINKSAAENVQAQADYLRATCQSMGTCAQDEKTIKEMYKKLNAMNAELALQLAKETNAHTQSNHALTNNTKVPEPSWIETSSAELQIARQNKYNAQGTVFAGSLAGSGLVASPVITPVRAPRAPTVPVIKVVTTATPVPVGDDYVPNIVPTSTPAP